MFKHVSLLERQEGMGHGMFVDIWQTNHTPIASEIDGVVRYQTVVPTDPAHAEFDGLAEWIFEDLDALHDAFGRPGSGEYDLSTVIATEARADMKNSLAIEDCQRFTGEERVQKDETGGDTTGLYKHSAFLVRKEGLSHEEFLDYWQTKHTPIAREIEGVVRYTTVLPTDPEHSEFDGVAELYFEDLDALYDALGSEGSRDYDPDQGHAKRAREDVDNFLAIEKRPRFIGRETVHVDRMDGNE